MVEKNQTKKMEKKFNYRLQSKSRNFEKFKNGCVQKVLFANTNGIWIVKKSQVNELNQALQRVHEHIKTELYTNKSVFYIGYLKSARLKREYKLNPLTKNSINNARL